MRVRIPLSVKILGWFFLNLLLLAIIGLFFAQQKLRFGLDSLVAGPAGDRVRAVAILVIQELNDAPRAQWNSVLERYGRESGIELLLFSEAGTEIAGERVLLPGEVAMRLRESGPPRPPRRDDRPPPENRRPPPPEQPPPARGPQVIGLMRAGNPIAYWTLIHAPLPQLGPEGPAILIFKSSSLSAGGLIFDFKPLLWSAAAAIFISVLFWLPLIRGITRTVGQMRSATARIAEGHFDSQLEDQRSDELGALAASIKQMSERLSGLINGQRRFLSDVAHELCAPLSRLQVALGILEERLPEAGKLADVREEVDQISELVNELLSFSRASLGTKKLQLRPVEIRPLLEQVARREADGNARVIIECAVAVSACADRDLLTRAISNLLRNAVHYAGHAGEISLSASRKNGSVEIQVADRGPGIPADSLPQIFDPFYRVDQSRARETGGVGLGLTIAKTCVEACGGSIKLENISPHGLRAVVSVMAS